MTKGQQCENCQYWKEGDPADAVANKGVCTFTLLSKKNIPFWMDELARVTINWQGDYCRAWVHNGKPLTSKGGAL